VEVSVGSMSYWYVSFVYSAICVGVKKMLVIKKEIAHLFFSYSFSKTFITQLEKNAIE
jgi:hypothetical protein